MSRIRPPGLPNAQAGRSAGFRPCPAGWRVIVPGWPQWGWGQRSRGGVLFGSWLSALAVSAFEWGTTTGLVLWAFALAAHAFSAVDAWSQPAFPPMRGWVPWLTALLWLSIGLYLPVLVMAGQVAWLGLSGDGHSQVGYLIDRWAYRRAAPRPGDWIWFQPTEQARPRLGRIMAGSGQEVEWARNQFRVEGRSVRVPTPYPQSESQTEVAFRVPEGHVLVNPVGRGQPSSAPLILGHERLLGRAWAQFYPVLERRLLN